MKTSASKAAGLGWHLSQHWNAAPPKDQVALLRRLNLASLTP